MEHCRHSDVNNQFNILPRHPIGSQPDLPVAPRRPAEQRRADEERVSQLPVEYGVRLNSLTIKQDFMATVNYTLFKIIPADSARVRKVIFFPIAVCAVLLVIIVYPFIFVITKYFFNSTVSLYAQQPLRLEECQTATPAAYKQRNASDSEIESIYASQLEHQLSVHMQKKMRQKNML